MATRQYIGARYVPKFAEPIGWVKENSYEALTVVTYLNNSYTSKKPVPANTEITNTDYWVVTGNYNAQVEQYRQETKNLENKVNQLSDKRTFILLGDSFSTGIDGNNNTQTVAGGGWIDRFIESTPYKVYRHTDKRAGISGFASSLEFLTMLKDVEEKIENPNLVTDIIILGGTNDVGYVNNVEAKIKEFCNYAFSKFPNAKIGVGVIGTMCGAFIDNGIFNAYSTVRLYGGYFIKTTTMLYCKKEYVGSDKTHLTANGYAYYTRYVNQAILTGETNFEFDGRITIQKSGESKYVVLTVTVCQSETIIDTFLSNDNIEILSGISAVNWAGAGNIISNTLQPLPNNRIVGLVANTSENGNISYVAQLVLVNDSIAERFAFDTFASESRQKIIKFGGPYRIVY